MDQDHQGILRSKKRIIMHNLNFKTTPKQKYEKKVPFSKKLGAQRTLDDIQHLRTIVDVHRDTAQYHIHFLI